jgi:uncharacterized protein (DUF433 family)
MNSFLAKRIVYDPNRSSDGPFMRDTGVSVDLVLETLAEHPDSDFVLARFPSLDVTDIRAAIEFAREAASDENGADLPRTLAELGWTKEQAASVREQLQPFADDWDDPSMDIYDALTPAR